MIRAAELERRLKAALDESRLLILGAQVLFGFQFEAAFQESFSQLPHRSQLIHCGALIAMVLSICFLIAPSLIHQIRFAGETRLGALSTATNCAGASLLPLTLALGAAFFMIFEHLFGTAAGIIVGTTLTAVALILFYGFGLALARGRKMTMVQEPHTTPLETKIEQMLTEARVIIPGGQALLGFQFIAALTKPFQDLPVCYKEIHAAGLCAVALSVLLLMTPAALHRIAFHGDNDENFFRIGSILIILGALPLSLGIAINVAIVFFMVTAHPWISMTAGTTTLLVLCTVWFAYPVWQRQRTAS